jgi:hypothetical protein
MTPNSTLSNAASGKLARLLIAKSVAETLLIGTIAVVVFLTLFPPFFRGWGEVTSNSIAGWAVNQAAPWDRVEVQLFIDGRCVASTIANLSRPDVRAAGWASDEWHGYSFSPLSVAPGSHLAQVYALHSNESGTRRTLKLLGDPLFFFVDRNGTFNRVDLSIPPERESSSWSR